MGQKRPIIAYSNLTATVIPGNSWANITYLQALRLPIGGVYRLVLECNAQAYDDNDTGAYIYVSLAKNGDRVPYTSRYVRTLGNANAEISAAGVHVEKTIRCKKGDIITGMCSQPTGDASNIVYDATANQEKEGYLMYHRVGD